jgi:cholesterol transport system auxiliary component
MNARACGRSWLRAAAVLGAVLGMLLAGGCGSLLPKPAAPPVVYTLDAARTPTPATPVSRQPLPAASSASAQTLVVNAPRAAPGFDSRQIVYVRSAHRLEHFAHSEWVDTPARMLAPLIVDAVENAGGFRAVGPPASGIAGSLRLDTEILRLQQEFGNGPSRVRFSLRAYLLDDAAHRVVSSREFDESVISESEDPQGGVIAANRVVQLVMTQLADYCRQAAAHLR